MVSVILAAGLVVRLAITRRRVIEVIETRSPGWLAVIKTRKIVCRPGGGTVGFRC